jgi:chromosomal replication initiator protein
MITSQTLKRLEDASLELRAALAEIRNGAGLVRRKHRAVEIIEMVAANYDTTMKVIVGRKRTKHIAEARHVAMYLGRLFGHSSNELGRLFKRNHGTILYAQSAVQDRIDTSAAFAARVATLKQQANAL